MENCFSLSSQLISGPSLAGENKLLPIGGHLKNNKINGNSIRGDFIGC